MAATAALFVFFCVAMQAQGPASQPLGQNSATPPPDAKQAERTEAERELKAEEQQRLLGVVPNFNVVMGGQALPLTGKQKWNLALHSTTDPFYIGWAFVVGGGYSELTGSNSGNAWEQTTLTTSTAR